MAQLKIEHSPSLQSSGNTTGQRTLLSGKAAPHHGLASRWKRLGGGLIDLLLLAVITVSVMLATGVSPLQPVTIGQQAAGAVFGFVVFLLLNGYLLFKKGQTIGKVVVKTRIIDLSDNVPSFGKLIVLRYLIFTLAAFIPIVNIVGLVNALFIFRKERRCLHDYMAGTRVINCL